MKKEKIDDLTKSFARKVDHFVGLTSLTTLIILGFAMLVLGQTMSGQGWDETIFLPLVNQSILQPYDTQKSTIKWYSDYAPFDVAMGQAVVAHVAGGREYLYLIGGGEEINEDGRVIQTNRASYTEIYEDGSLGTWSSLDGATALPKLPWELYGFTATAVDDVIYVLGGLNYPAGGSQFPIFNGTAFCAEVEQDGSFTSWEHRLNTWNLPKNYEYEEGVAYHATVVMNGRIYIIGGLRRNLYFQRSWDETPYVFSAEIKDDGNCHDLTWQKETSLPRLLKGHTAVVGPNDNHIYVIGRKSDGGDGPQAMTFQAELGSLELGEWEEQAEIPIGNQVYLATAVRSGDYIYLIGGTTTSTPYQANDKVYRTKIDANGDLQPWTTLEPFAQQLYGHAAVTSQIERIYVIGGVNTEETTPDVQNTIYWTPLVFFSKESTPQGSILPGQEISYSLIATSNNVRDLNNVTITDTLPTSLRVVSASEFIQNGQILTATVPTLPINHLAKWTFTAVVSPTEIPTPNSSLAITTPDPELQTTSASEITVQPIESNIRPTQVKGCVVADDVNTNNGTPRPKPTCTPPPPVTVTITPSVTVTITPSITTTVTVTPTTLTPTPEPVFVVNQALLCFEGQTWCKLATAVNAPSRIYLPLVTK